MNDPQDKEQRLRDLSADQALFGLAAEEQAELRDLAAGSNIDPESFEWTAALAAVAMNADNSEPLPESLRAKIAAAAPRHLATGRPSSFPAAAPTAARAPASPASTPEKSPKSRGVRIREVMAWCAAAACLLIAAFSLTRTSLNNPLPPSQARAALLKDASDVIQVNWTPTEDPTAKGAKGDVVWSNDKQKGYLTFKGLAKNDPKVNQYQLWIFDGKQDEKYPIDGGVFDIDSVTGDVVVPIDAKIRVVDPKMFAVTVEKPGGVVVSSREHIALIAKK